MSPMPTHATTVVVSRVPCSDGALQMTDGHGQSIGRVVAGAVFRLPTGGSIALYEGKIYAPEGHFVRVDYQGLGHEYDHMDQAEITIVPMPSRAQSAQERATPIA